jgi:hypothetical protein
MESGFVKINHEFKTLLYTHKALIEADIEIQKNHQSIEKDKY